RPADRKEVLDVARAGGVVRELVGAMRPHAEEVWADSELDVPALADLDPLAGPALGFPRRHDELHLHPLELPRPEDGLAGRDLVAERLADLGYAEGRLLARERHHVLEVDEDALRRLRPQVDLRALARDRSDVGLEHQVELARLRQLAAALGAAQLGARVAP